MLRLAPCGAGLSLRCCGGRQGCFGGRNGLALRLNVVLRDDEFALNGLQTAAFGEPARRAGQRMGGDREAVPAPQIALARDQPLTGLEHLGELWPVGALDHADLRQPPRQFGRPLDELRQRYGAFRQRRIGRVVRCAAPAHRRRIANRRVEIVTERGAERLFVVAGDCERVHHRRPKILVLDRQELADGLGLSLEPLHRAFGGDERAASRIHLLARCDVGGF